MTGKDHSGYYKESTDHIFGIRDYIFTSWDQTSDSCRYNGSGSGQIINTDCVYDSGW